METLQVERSNGVVTVAFDRPEKKNAVNSRMWDELLEVAGSIIGSTDDRCVVLTGAGGDFCSGADLSAGGDGDRPTHQLAAMRGINAVVQAFHELPQPTIAKVDGVAAGVGMNLALGCDLVVASDRARFSEIFAQRGLSLDGGGSWARFEGGIPKVAVRDLDIHPREHDLIVATHGRGIYILDDLTPLRALTPEILDSKVALLPARPAVQFLTSQIQSFNGDQDFVGESLGETASVFFYQEKRHLFGEMKLEVFDRDGELLATLPAGKRPGLNRVDWPMRLGPPRMPPATSLAMVFQGPRVPEGRYPFKLTKGKEVLEGEIELSPDPRGSYSAEDRALQQSTALALYDGLEELTYIVDALVALRDQARERAGGAHGRTAKRLADYAGELEAFRGSLVSTSDAGWLSGEERLRERLADVFGGVAGYDGRPTQSQIERAAVLSQELDAARATFEEWTGSELAEVNARLDEPLTRVSREQWEEDQTKAGSGARGPALARRIAAWAERGWVAGL
jgi:hypothetical protein